MPFAPLQTGTLQATMAKLLTILTGGILETEAYADAHGDTTGTADCCTSSQGRQQRDGP